MSFQHWTKWNAQQASVERKHWDVHSCWCIPAEISKLSSLCQTFHPNPDRLILNETEAPQQKSILVPQLNERWVLVLLVQRVWSHPPVVKNFRQYEHKGEHKDCRALRSRGQWIWIWLEKNRTTTCLVGSTLVHLFFTIKLLFLNCPVLKTKGSQCLPPFLCSLMYWWGPQFYTWLQSSCQSHKITFVDTFNLFRNGTAFL